MKGGGSILLTQVEYVPTARDNLFSVSAAVNDGCTFSVNEKGESHFLSMKRVNIFMFSRKEWLSV